MMKFIIGSGLLVILLSFAVSDGYYRDTTTIDPDQSVLALLESMGENYTSKKPKFGKNVSAQVGEDIVKYGFSDRDGFKNSGRQSKHFVCTSCHNTQQEDPDLTINDPQARLEYVVKNGMPFLQGTALYGAVNRETYYNGDYYIKYGDLVEPARKDVREAIQLCAQECAQGRKLKDWELESILAYLWTIDLKISDLNLSDLELSSIESAMKNDVIKGEGIKLIKSKYIKASEATFIPPPPDRKAGTGYPGDKDNGQLIYEQSCLHCHEHGRYSFLYLDNNKMSFQHLNSKAETYNRHSIYQVIRYGTYSKYGKKSYMPQYPAEKMNDQQLADLRAYIEYRAKL